MPDGAVTVGFYGKLPARGDFVRGGLPRDFVDAWDAWWQRELSAVQTGEDWVAAWLEAPIWRFHLAPGVCGAAAVVGVWLPSVDRANRYFPLTIAAVGTDLTDRFLDAAEAAALDALEHDLDPEMLGRRVAATYGPGSPAIVEPGHSAWWTAGGPRVAAAAFTQAGLPEGAAFDAMLDDRERCA